MVIVCHISVSNTVEFLQIVQIAEQMLDYCGVPQLPNGKKCPPYRTIGQCSICEQRTIYLLLLKPNNLQGIPQVFIDLHK